MQLDDYDQRYTETTQKEFYLQRTNDLLEQIERLKRIDVQESPELQIKVSLAIKALYETLEALF